METEKRKRNEKVSFLNSDMSQSSFFPPKKEFGPVKSDSEKRSKATKWISAKSDSHSLSCDVSFESKLGNVSIPPE
jgi:hypothetical protein